MSKKFLVPRGTNDILPLEIPLWQHVEAKARDILKNYNYKEIRTPFFEETELFVRSMGQTSDVVQKQMLNLGSDLSLRPENTASVVRAYIQHSLDRKENLSKLFYIGPMFRGERPQKGRLRQFHQMGGEAIGPGTCSPYLDAEVIALSVNMLKSFGLNNFQLKINTLGSPEDKENFSGMLRKMFKSPLEGLCEDCQKRYERNVFRILDCKNKDCRAIVNAQKIDHSYLSDESHAYYAKVKEALESLGIAYEESLNLVRGLDYYTHTVFEISDASLGSQDALGAGGRYNDLVPQLGGPQVDAIGFALGVERILLAMPQDKEFVGQTPTVFVIALDETAFAEAFSLVNTLRQEGVPSDINYKVSSVKSQMRSANKSGARYVALLGEDELKNNVVTVKDMETGNQEQLELTKLIGKVK